MKTLLLHQIQLSLIPDPHPPQISSFHHHYSTCISVSWFSTAAFHSNTCLSYPIPRCLTTWRVCLWLKHSPSLLSLWKTCKLLIVLISKFLIWYILACQNQHHHSVLCSSNSIHDINPQHSHAMDQVYIIIIMQYMGPEVVSEDVI